MDEMEEYRERIEHRTGGQRRLKNDRRRTENELPKFWDLPLVMDVALLTGLAIWFLIAIQQ